MKTVQIDATNMVLGRLATKIALVLRGKDQPDFDPSVLPEVEVVVENLEKVKFTGRKFTDKTYYRYSGYPGGIRARTMKDLWDRNPKEVVMLAVWRMLPENRTRKKIIKNIKFK